MTLASLWSPFLVAAVVCATTTPMIMRLACTLGVVDRPNERKVNRRANIPLLGGLAVALGFYAGIAVAIGLNAIEPAERDSLEGQLLGSLILLALGVVDDRQALSARSKLVIQLIAAAVAIYYGFRIDRLTDPVSRTSLVLPELLTWVVTLLWILGITNAMNLMDGLDGLATGLGLIIGTTLTWIAWQADQVVGVIAGIAFVGALLGFLPFNFPPARIFLGDTGALFIGYNLALLAISGYRRLSVLTFLVPLLALAVPLLDTTLSIYRRIRKRAPIMSPDKQHMHHRLLETAGSDRSAVFSLWFLTACFCVIAVSFTNLEGWAALVFLLIVIVLTVRLLRNLGFFDVGEGREAGSSGQERP